MKMHSIYEMIAHHYLNKKKVTKPIDLSQGKKLLIMATGKSANDYWENIENQKKFKDYDLLVMNRSIYKMEKQILEKKPRFFAMCDSIYWGGQKISVSQELAEETYRRTKEMLEKIDWECFLLTSIQERFDFVNEKVHIIRLNATTYEADKEISYRLYAKNFCSPSIRNVGQLAIYFGITFGYKEIAIVGMDFDFFKNLFCDIKGRVGLYAEHQYDKIDGNVVEAFFTKENFGTINNSVLAKYLVNIADTFSGYGKLGIYAEKMGSRVINYSVSSMIDCYEKRSLSD